MNIKSSLSTTLISTALLVAAPATASDMSVARQWNEVLLESIRNDLARPTVHARNLFHTSVVMYDAWAAYDAAAEPFLLGKTVEGYHCAFPGLSVPVDREGARREAISYAAYRLLRHRFTGSPGAAASLQEMDQLMVELGYDPAMTSTGFAGGPRPPANPFRRSSRRQFSSRLNPSSLGRGASAGHLPRWATTSRNA